MPILAILHLLLLLLLPLLLVHLKQLLVRLYCGLLRLCRPRLCNPPCRPRMLELVKCFLLLTVRSSSSVRPSFCVTLLCLHLCGSSFLLLPLQPLKHSRGRHLMRLWLWLRLRLRL